MYKKEQCFKINIVRMQEHTGTPQMTTVVDDQRVLSIVKEKTFSTVEHAEDTLNDVGICQRLP